MSVRDDTLRMVNQVLSDNERLRQRVADLTTDVDKYRTLLKSQNSLPNIIPSPLQSKMDNYHKKSLADLKADCDEKVDRLEHQCRSLERRLEECQTALDQERIVKSKILKDVSELASNEDQNKQLAREYAAELKEEHTENKRLKERVLKLEAQREGAKERHAMELKVVKEMFDMKMELINSRPAEIKSDSSNMGLVSFCIQECIELICCFSSQVGDIIDDGQSTVKMAIRNTMANSSLLQERLNLEESGFLKIIQASSDRIKDLESLVSQQAKSITEMQEFIDISAMTYLGRVADLEARCGQVSRTAEEGLTQAGYTIKTMERNYEAAEASAVHEQYVEQTTAKKEKRKLTAEVERLMEELGNREVLIDCMEEEIDTLKSKLSLAESETRLAKTREKELGALRRQNNALISKLEQMYVNKANTDTHKQDTLDAQEIRKLTTELRAKEFEIKDLQLEIEVLHNQVVAKCKLVRTLEEKLSKLVRGSNKEDLDSSNKAHLHSKDRLRVDVNLFKEENSSKFSSTNWPESGGKLLIQ